MRELAIHILLQENENSAKEQEDLALQMALISSDPDRWLPMFYPEEFSKPVDVQDYVGDDGMPDFSGITVKWADPIEPEQAEDIFKTLLGDPTGNLGVS